MAEIPPRDPRKGDERPVIPDSPTHPARPGPEVQPTNPPETPTPELPDEIQPPA